MYHMHSFQVMRSVLFARANCLVPVSLGAPPCPLPPLQRMSCEGGRWIIDEQFLVFSPLSLSCRLSLSCLWLFYFKPYSFYFTFIPNFFNGIFYFFNCALQLKLIICICFHFNFYSFDFGLFFVLLFFWYGVFNLF